MTSIFTPLAVDLEPGKDYYFCTCGLSKNQPFCDGTHRTAGTDFKPKKFSVEEKKKYYLCGCKLSSNLPFCDGTHRSETGIKAYNQFLLKKNTELTIEMKRRRIQWFGGSIMLSAFVGVLVYYLK